MAIPIGTTSRQLGALVRWMYLTVVLVGLLTWWWPDYSTWGALIGGLLTSLMLWLCWRTVSVNRSVPGHPVYLALLIPAAILTYHLAQKGLGQASADSGLVSGALNVSLLLHVAMLALGVMLSQSLLPKAINSAIIVRICGAAMIGAGVLAGFRNNTEPVRQAMALVGYAGIAVCLEPLWRPTISSIQQGFAPPPHRQAWKILSLILAGSASAILAWSSPGAAVLASIGAGMTLVIAAVVFSRRSRELLLAGTVLAIIGGAGVIAGAPLPKALTFNGPLLGSGERAFGRISAPDGQVLQAVCGTDSGMQILCRTIGAHGAILTVAGLAVCLLIFLARARRDHSGDKAKCVAWTVAAMLCAAAMLDRGGLFIPAVTLAFGLTWGLAAEAAGRSATPRPGVTILVLLGGTMVLIGVAKSGGLLMWSAQAVWGGPGADKLLHVVFGAILSMTMAWLIGSRSVRLGLAAIGLACLLGGVGEVVQYMTVTGRSVEWSDWGAHAAGSIAAAAPYLLCIGARQCESTDATGHDLPIRDPYSG